MTNYKTEQLAQEEKSEELARTLWRNREYKNEIEAEEGLKSYLLSRDQALIEAFKKDTAVKVSALQDALIWCSGSDDFQLEGKARVGWEKICVPLLKDYNLNK